MRVVKFGAIGIGIFVILPAAAMAAVEVAMEDDENGEVLEKESLIKGSRDASLTVLWPSIQEKMAHTDSHCVGVVE